MDLDEGALKLIDPENLTTLNTQPIHTIRVWGVGRDNGRYAPLVNVNTNRIGPRLSLSDRVGTTSPFLTPNPIFRSGTNYNIFSTLCNCSSIEEERTK